MLTLIRRRLARDEGLSIAEMLIALFIMAIALSALASSIITSLTAISRDERRVRATQLANQLIEDLRGMPWDEVTFYADDGAPTTFSDGATTYDSVVALDNRPTATPLSAAPLPGPQTTTRDGITYTTTTNIYWVDDPGDGVHPADTDPQDYKAFHVLIEWTDRGRAYSFTSTGTRIPTVDEVPVSPTATPTVPPGTFVITSMFVDPSAVTIGPSGFTEQSILVTVTTSLNAQPPNLVAGSNNVIMSSADGTATSWEYTIPSGDGTFVSGDYDFTVTALEEAGGGGGSDTEVRTVTFSETPSLTQVLISTPTLAHASPGPVAPPLCTNSGGPNNKDLKYDVTLQFEVTGVGTAAPDSSARIEWSNQSGSATATYVSANGTGDGAIYTAVIPTGSRFNGTSTTVIIIATRTVDAVEADESFTYLVQSGGC